MLELGVKRRGLWGKCCVSLVCKHRFISITHLPQVAACAHHHLNVSKKTQSGQTHSTLSYLSSPQRVEEISRMLGGIQITDSTRQHAQEMLEMAKE